MTTLLRLFYRMSYKWHKVDEYLARCRGDYALASHDLNLALKAQMKYRSI